MLERQKISKQKKKQISTQYNRPPNYSTSNTDHIHPLLQLQRTVGNQTVLRLLQSGTLQAKLRIDRLEGIYEKEATPIPPLKNSRQPLSEKKRFFLEKRFGINELTTVVQGRGRGLRIQMTPEQSESEEEGFVFMNSEIAGRIRQGLESESATYPSPLGEGRRIRPVNPDHVLRILNSSNLFKEAAAEAERLYFTSSTRTPELTFTFHLRPELGSEFQRAESRIVVEVSNLRAVVEAIVHEIVHSLHPAPSPARPTPRIGSVTRAEEAGVREEAQTIFEERQIITDIVSQEAWGSLTRNADIEPVPERAEDLHEEVRGSFRSGLPKLTYQEGFIIEEMKRLNRVSGMNEAEALEAAQALIDPTWRANPENFERFNISPEDIESHRRRIEVQEPVRPPSLSQAMESARLYRANRSWQRAFEGSNRLPDDIELSGSSRAFIEGFQSPLWRGAIPWVPTWAYARAMRREPYDSFERRQFYFDLLLQMRIEYDTIIHARQESGLVMRWFRTVPAESHDQALEFFEWLLIQEAMSGEWLSIGSPTPDPEVRGRHMDFLEARIGRDLRGISRRGLGD